MASRLSNISDETLTAMLQEYAEKLRLSYSLTWATASAFLPVSLAGIAVYDVKDREWTVTLVGIASVGLIWLWYFIALRVRAFADHDRLIYHEIELEILSRQKVGFESFDNLGTCKKIKNQGLFDEAVPRRGFIKQTGILFFRRSLISTRN